MNFKKGMKVKKTFKGLGGYREETEAIVGKVSKTKNTVWLCDDAGNLETGVTYDLNGKEKENFFLPMTSKIAPLTEEKPKLIQDSFGLDASKKYKDDLFED